MPLWAVLFVVAAFAPYAARLLERALLARRRRRTEAALREAGLDAAAGDADPGP